MASPAGALLLLVADRSADVEDGLKFDIDRMPWDEYRALRALRSEVEKAKTEKQGQS